MLVNAPEGSSRHFSFRGERVHFIEMGAGPPVVLLHGAGPAHPAGATSAAMQLRSPATSDC
jgi:hypothetical protein